MKFPDKLPLIYHNTEEKPFKKNVADKATIKSSWHQTSKFGCSIFYKPISKVCPLKS